MEWVRLASMVEMVTLPGIGLPSTPCLAHRDSGYAEHGADGPAVHGRNGRSTWRWLSPAQS